MDPHTVSVCLHFNGFDLDEADARLTCGHRPVPLAPKPFAVLCALARSPHRLVTRHDLLDAVWGHRLVANSALKSAISEVRAALGDDPKQPRYIETISRRGYRFIATPLGMPSHAAAVGRDDPDQTGHSALAALTALCREDTAVASLIRAVAASLGSEQRPLDDHGVRFVA